jgi:hypothetical protein
VAFCNEKILLNRFQSGLGPGHSTTTAFLKITDDISMEMNCIFNTILDFSKAVKFIGESKSDLEIQKSTKIVC